ncbi:hypothetical protein BKA61DRAFT_710186 [Leptodontidium sp. MPI-SDFR-AT-0119]|nr:hypothetical protein BKA61DRAFT_710186 [Leptodontidium sp. MPI-SDFR-AT-0119]
MSSSCSTTGNRHWESAKSTTSSTGEGLVRTVYSGLVTSPEERDYYWWVLGMSAVRLGDQIFNWQSIQAACAVSTTIIYGAAILTTYQRVGRLATWLGNSGISIGNFKRDEISADDQDMLNVLSEVFGVEVSQLGGYMIPTGNFTVDKRAEGQVTRVLGFTQPDGLQMHFAYVGNVTVPASTPTQTSATHLHFKFSFGNGTTTTSIRGRQQYNEQYFNGDGIDFIIISNPSDGGVLSQNNDYGQMDHEVSCYMGNNRDAVGHYYQVYDNNHSGTIVGGAVAPFRAGDHWSWIIQMYNPPFPIATAALCAVGK